jgi:hypothetical protein
MAMARTPSKAGIYFIPTKLKKRAQESNLLSTYMLIYPRPVSFVEKNVDFATMGVFLKLE